MHGSRHWLTCLLLLAVIVGCAAPEAPSRAAQSTAPQPAASAPSPPKRFVAAIRGYPKSVATAIDGAGAGSTAGLRETAQLVNAGLTTPGGKGQLIPRLAEQVPTLDNGLWKLLPDGRMETTWKIKQGVVWQDGTPFTTDDLLFTSKVAQDRDLAIALDSTFDWVESVEAADSRTITVRWKQPFVEADGLFADTTSQSMLPLPRHLLEAAYTEDKAAFTTLPFWSEQFVGLGPYKVRELVVDSHLLLEANDRYVLGRPKIDEIEVRFVGDFTVLVAQVLAGAVDMNFGRGLSLEQGLEAKNQWRDGQLQTNLDTVTALFPQFHNPTPTAMLDVRFRRAMLHAIDRQQITDTLQHGYSAVAHSPLIPNDPDGKEVEGSVVRYAFEPARSRQLIEEVGFVRGPDGLYQDRSGQKLVVKIQTTIDDLRQKTMEVIGDYWKEIGVTYEGVVIPRQSSSDRQLRSEFASFDFTRQPPDPTRYHGNQTPLAENNYRGSNRTRYRNAEFDALLDRYVLTIPRPERMQVLGQIVQHMTDQLVILGVFYTVKAVLVSNRVTSMKLPDTDVALQTWNAHEWDIK